MVDITNQLAPLLIEHERLRLESKYGGKYIYNNDGTFSRVTRHNQEETFEVDNLYGTAAVRPRREVRVQSGSAFEPPQDNDTLLQEPITAINQINANQIATGTISSEHLTAREISEASNKLVEETWGNSKTEETRKIARKKLNSKPKDLPRKIDL